MKDLFSKGLRYVLTQEKTPFLIKSEIKFVYYSLLKNSSFTVVKDAFLAQSISHVNGASALFILQGEPEKILTTLTHLPVYPNILSIEQLIIKNGMLK